ncbi:MAG TPA: hypothetical protein VGD00_10335 [Solirubrobacteraceae bacterium]|jgi:hypothetical protein
MKHPESPPPEGRPLLIPLDDQEALLALRDFERRDEPHDALAAEQPAAPGRGTPRAA